MNPSLPKAPEHGAALLVVLWCLSVLVAVLILTAAVVDQEMDGIAARIAQDRARQLALAGLTLARHPAVQPGDPLLHQDLGNGERFEVRVSTEEARLNLNVWIAEDRQPALVQLFRFWGLERRDAERLVHALADWADPDTLRRSQGAERRDYGGLNRPYNRPFLSLDEVRLVRDFALLERVRPDWRSRLSVRGQATLDLMEAPPDLIAAITGSTPESVALWVRDRWGRDGIRHTDDDPLPPSVGVVLQQLGLPPTAPSAAWVTVQGPTRRYQATGVKGDYLHVVHLLTTGDAPAAGATPPPAPPPDAPPSPAPPGAASILWMEEHSGRVGQLDPGPGQHFP
jgi:hypothetical protein